MHIVQVIPHRSGGLMLRHRYLKLAFALGISIASTGTASGQWLNYKTPGIPRTAAGKPDLSAPAPRTADGRPDFTGVWRNDNSASAETSKAMQSIRALPWAEALSKKRVDDYLKDGPLYTCLPPGPMVEMGPGRIVQATGMLMMAAGGTLYREIFLDGRPLPEIVNPDWMGYSAGRWEKETLLIETTGFNDKTWIDFNGHPHTEALRVTERIRRPDFGHLEVLKTLTDPGALAEPWTVPLRFELDADNDPLEYVCNENERDRQHFVGKLSDLKGIQVDPAILAKYAGSYELKVPEIGRPVPATVKLDGDHLTLTTGGPPAPLTARSETEFTASFGNVRFEKDAKDQVTALILQAVEGDLRAIRK
jgi:hypothetical protein